SSPTSKSIEPKYSNIILDFLHVTNERVKERDGVFISINEALFLCNPHFNPL
ncbi:hypothetical protein HMPREF1372_00108, partial [Enterococcus faecium P1139]